MTLIKEMTRRVHKFYESEASAETDLQKTREALIAFHKLATFLKIYLNHQLINKGTNGPFAYVSSILDLPYPSQLTTQNMFLIKSKDLFDRDENLLFALCIGPSIQGKNLTGTFLKDGINHNPTVFLYLMPDKIDYSLGQVFRKQLIQFISSDRDLQKSFVHEYKHYTDLMEALNKNPNSNPLKGYKIYRPMPKTGESRIKQPNTTHNYSTYVNNNSEVNARYAEWIVDILYSFDTLPQVKSSGILSAFPNFTQFWDYMWAHYAPEEFIEYATPKVERYLKKRLYKFYTYVLDFQRVPATKDEASRLAKQFIEKDEADEVAA